MVPLGEPVDRTGKQVGRRMVLPVGGLEELGVFEPEVGGEVDDQGPSHEGGAGLCRSEVGETGEDHLGGEGLGLFQRDVAPPCKREARGVCLAKAPVDLAHQGTGL